MMKLSKIIVAFSVCVLGSQPSYANLLDRLLEFQLHGYLNGYYIPQNMDDTIKTKTRLRDSTIEGTLNLTWLISPRSKIAAQLTAQYPELYKDDSLRVDMFSYNHLIYAGENSQTSIALGRLKNSWIGFNSAQAHPLERPGVTRPLVYLNDVGEVFLPVNGVSLYGDAWLTTGDSLNWTLYGGYRDIALKTDSLTNINNALDKGYTLFGTKLLYSPAFIGSFQTGLSLLRVDYDVSTASQYKSRDIGVLMIKHDVNQWVGSFELAQIRSHTTAQGNDTINQAAYVQVTWNPRPSWTSWLRYSYMNYPPALPSQKEQEGDGVTLALRYQTEEGWFLGSQLSHLSLPHLRQNKYINKQDTLLLLQAAYYF